MLFAWRITVAYLRIFSFLRQKWSLQHVPIVLCVFFLSFFHVMSMLFLTPSSFVQFFSFSFLWHCDLILDHGIPLQGFGITYVERSALGTTPLYEWSARSRDLYLKTHDTYKRKASMPWRDSNQQSQQSSGRIPKLYTTRPPGSVLPFINFYSFFPFGSSLFFFMFEGVK